MSNALYVLGVEVGSISHGFEAPTTAQWLHSASSSDPGFLLTFVSIFELTTVGGNGNSMMMDPCPHPQHMKDVKCLVYI